MSVRCFNCGDWESHCRCDDPPAFKPGDKVVKNHETWVPNEFDGWGRGEGVGVVMEPEPGFEDDIDVRWPNGRCFEDATGLLLHGPQEEAAN